VGNDPRITPDVYNLGDGLKRRSRAANFTIALIGALAAAFATATGWKASPRTGVARPRAAAVDICPTNADVARGPSLFRQ